ncbi:MAG: TonB-dependent receptor [Microscillaceae bacterium]|jgi:iron complex outermembrane receptor protein|nr:TonB-dependent receptor [Microscillaceae bacterium]
MIQQFTKRLFLIGISLFISFSAFAQTKIAGKAVDSESGSGLPGVNVVVKGTAVGTITDNNGAFAIEVKLTPPFTLLFSYVGYGTQELLVDGSNLDNVEVKMSAGTLLSDEIVVSASRRPEKLTEAPSAISVINSADFERAPTFNIGELASKLQGVEFVRTGVNGVGFNIRGFNNAFNAKILTLTDGRNSMMAGGSGLPAGIMNTVIKEDIERFEVVLGPASALYGPNAHNGVVNLITKDPRRSEGTTVVLSAGNQDVVSARLRRAQKINDKFAYKVNLEYSRGKDFEFRDSVYVGGAAFGLPATSVAERNVDFNFRHIRGEAALYYAVNKNSDIIVSYGGSQNNFLGVNNVGRNQIRDWRFSYLQARYVSPHVFAQVYYTWTNVGSTYGITPYTRDYHNFANANTPARLTPNEAEAFALRLGNRFKETSGRWNAEVQYNGTWKKFFFVAGLSYQKDLPNTFGTSLVDAPDAQGNQNLITIQQFGGVLQVERELGAGFKFVAAARLDNHSVFGNLFAPKGGLLWNGLGGTFRVTYGRAFAAPIILFQSANVFNLVFGNGKGVTYVPIGSTTEVSTTPIKPESLGTLEIGYKGVIAKKLFVDVNGYYSNTKNFLSPTITLLGRAVRVGDVPVTPASSAFFLTYFNYGKVASYGADLGLNYMASQYVNIGLKYSYFGSDITQDKMENDANQDGYVSAEEKSLNAPQNRIVANIALNNLFNKKFFANFSMRWVQAFDFYSGNQIATADGAGQRGRVLIGPGTNRITGQVRTTDTFAFKNFNYGALGGFTSFDFSAGYRFSKMVQLGGGVSNIFNAKQREFVGSPIIGRLYSFELRFNLP